MVVLSKKPKTFEIKLRDPSPNFYSSGDKVSGVLLLEVSEVTRVASVKLNAVGCAEVRYKKNKQRCKEGVDYLKYQDVLHLDAHPTDPDGCVTLRPGNSYKYTFGFELPQPGQLVSSYRSQFGCVEYYVNVVMERPDLPAVECRKYFEVMEPVDINTSDLTSPVAAVKEKKLTCMFIPDGSVSIAAKIERQGYCEGENICIDARFENSCSRIIIPKSAIMATHTYLANGRVKVFRQKISAVRGDHIISGMSGVWQGKIIHVPKLKPTILGCNIIHLDYTLMIYLHIPGSDKLSLELPLVIGTIPFSGMSSRSNSMSSTAASSSTASMPSAPPSYSEIPRHGSITCTPLLEDYDEDDCPIFIHAERNHQIPPPAYTEVVERRAAVRLY